MNRILSYACGWLRDMETDHLLDPPRLLVSLRGDFARLRDVAARDLDAAVPTCPGWRVGDLVGHLAEVYLHKVEAMRRNRRPDPWPPDLDGEPRLALLDRAWAELM